MKHMTAAGLTDAHTEARLLHHKVTWLSPTCLAGIHDYTQRITCKWMWTAFAFHFQCLHRPRCLVRFTIATWTLVIQMQYLNLIEQSSKHVINIVYNTYTVPAALSAVNQLLSELVFLESWWSIDGYLFQYSRVCFLCTAVLYTSDSPLLWMGLRMCNGISPYSWSTH